MKTTVTDESERIEAENKQAATALMNLFFRHCTKECPNHKCSAKIQKVESGCTHMQCPVCYHNFCWVCLKPAKGQKHFKENPQCAVEAGSL